MRACGVGPVMVWVADKRVLVGCASVGLLRVPSCSQKIVLKKKSCFRKIVLKKIMFSEKKKSPITDP